MIYQLRDLPVLLLISLVPCVSDASHTPTRRMADVAPRFLEPSDDPARVMPVGTGDLSAMLRYGTDLEIHLSKTDFFGFDRSNYHRNPTVLSPGRVRLSFGIAREKILSFEQRLDYHRGSVIFDIATPEGSVKAEAYGVMGGNTLLIDVKDARLVPWARANYSSWRPETTVTSGAERIVAREIHDYQWNFRPPNPAKIDPEDRMFRLGCATAIAFDADESPTCDAGALTLEKPGSRYRLLISTACTYDGKPELAASKLLDGALQKGRTALLAEHLDWWARFWQASFLELRGPDTDTLLRLWYSGHYSYASVAGGPVPPKFNGGPGLVEKDNRSWGIGLWWQNTRELIWPMGAANRTRYARDMLDFYDGTFMHWKLDTAKSGKLGLRMGEWVQPGKPGASLPPKRVSAFDNTALEKAVQDLTMENVESGYNARTLTQAAELTQLLFDYTAFTGDREFLKSVAVPWLKESALFYLSYLRKGDDGIYHIMVSDAAENWWKVKDSATDLGAIRYLFWQVLNHGLEFGYEPEFMAAIRERSAKLPPLPIGEWTQCPTSLPGRAGNATALVLNRSVNLYAPFGGVYDDQKPHNTENPELYNIYPFAIVDANSPKAEHERAVNTFRKRRCPNHAGWSQCPVQAARLRLDDTVDVIMDHARRHAKYPYGGWNSPGGKLKDSSTGAADAPYFDAMGVNLTALQESLLQSHHPTTTEKTDPLGGGPIVLLPAAPDEWSGRFKLLARGGFLVTVEFEPGRKPTLVIFESKRGGRMQFVNTFGECRIIRPSKGITSTRVSLIDLETRIGERIEIRW